MILLLFDKTKDKYDCRSGILAHKECSLELLYHFSFVNTPQNTRNSTLCPQFNFFFFFGVGGWGGGKFKGIFGIPGHDFLLHPNTFQSSESTNKIASEMPVPHRLGKYSFQHHEI